MSDDAKMRLPYAAIAALTFPDCSDAWSCLAPACTDADRTQLVACNRRSLLLEYYPFQLLSVTRLSLLAHPKAGGDAWSFRESVLHTMPVERWDIPSEVDLIEAVVRSRVLLTCLLRARLRQALKHAFAYYPWSHFGWLIQQLPPREYPQIESFLGRMLRQTPRHSAPGHYTAE